MRRLLAAVAVVAGTVVVPMTGSAAGGGGCRQARASEGTGDTVELRMNCFTPTVLRVEPGTTVTFVNRDPIDHDLSGTNLGGFDQLSTGDAVQHRFDRPGTYPYMCYLHPGMTGVVIVGDGRGGGLSTVVGAPALAGAARAVPAPEADRDVGVTPAVVAGLGLAAGAAGFVVLRRTRKNPAPEA